ncbi:hypothetical protein [Oryzifoliimicrobium ureilyticus]|uniref:hypothetical protein n=1 Tax=Oryzifoliimicrobium ureilyticus TaxID=3113724 RepID=UPI00307638A4
MSKYLIQGLIALALVLGIVGAAFAVISKIDAMTERAASSARAERDAYWKAEIAKSNEAAQAQISQNLRETMAAQNQAQMNVSAAENRARELEIENAALPDDDACGISRERGRLLNKR